ncbi:hypothetical protein [Neoroseomonas oryzicola]|uniref:Uncharacterized protein n=1 Tax=Neoroseomonas oryzicola TaxID=535904 RepID=A0A9X9WMV9_9PROT|nr:hypothetical protein [Neoroseomonas oryzicola]MBR0661669.1 hypothetical protein [Neoroseomonas oryzicola]NKE20164.1 hypothetical protein [Neoroseomonas oryzicola]
MEDPAFRNDTNDFAEVPGIVIRIPPGTAGHRRVAMLLAAIANPPRGPVTAAWQRRVASICRCYWDELERAEPLWRSTAGTFLPEELILDITDAKASLRETLRGLNRALAAADVLEPFFKRALIKAKGLEVPDHIGKPIRNAQIEKALLREADYRDVLEGDPAREMPARMPSIDSAGADRNFANRNLRPFRPVHHLVVAFSIVMDEWARDAVEEAADSRRSSGRPGVSPKIDWWFLARSPEYADRMIAMAQCLEPAIEHLELEHASDNRVIRLRLD